MPINGYFDEVFANAGDLTPVPDAPQAGGQISYTQGWPNSYQTPVSAGGYNISRSQTNQLFYDVTSAIQALQQFGGAAPFITSTMNGGSPFSYAQYARVLLDGVVYQSNIASNTDTPPTSNWTNITALNSISEQAITGTSHTVAVTDSAYLTKRSNSGTAMSDTLPGSSGGLANGNYGYYQNNDASASLTIAVGSGGTIYQGNLTGSVIILPGELWQWIAQGSGVYNVQRVAPAVLHSSSLQSNFKNLSVVWNSTTQLSVAADAMTVQDSNGNTRRLLSIANTISSGTSGANGLDTGSIAANTWYYVYTIFNPASGITANIISASSTGPTLPSGSTYVSGVIGAVKTDGSANFIGFKQYGREYQFTVGNNLTNLPIIISGVQGSIGTPTYVSASVTGYIPTAVAHKGYFLAVMFSTGSTDTMILCPNNSYGVSGSNPPFTYYNGADTVAHGVWRSDMILESNNVYYASDNSNSAVAVVGFQLNI